MSNKAKPETPIETGAVEVKGGPAPTSGAGGSAKLELPKRTPGEAAALHLKYEQERKRERALGMAHHFAGALLQNPKIDVILYGSPTEPGARGDCKNAGALLAHSAARLAADYLEEVDAMNAPPKVAETATQEEPSGGGAEATDDFTD